VKRINAEKNIFWKGIIKFIHSGRGNRCELIVINDPPLPHLDVTYMEERNVVLQRIIRNFPAELVKDTLEYPYSPTSVMYGDLRVKIDFTGLIEVIGSLLDSMMGPEYEIAFLNYGEEYADGKTIDETLRQKLRRRSYRLCHLTAVGDHNAWKHEISSMGLTPEEAAERIGVNIEGLVSNNVYLVYVPIGNLDKVLIGLDEWAAQRGISRFRIQDELVLVETTKKD
jgi:hypothetical protein